MESGYQWLEMDDGADIYVRWWKPENKPRAIIQLAHGMAEHIERYHHFATFLVHHGYAVIGNDHRGHGKTGAKSLAFGFFAEQNGFDRVVDDLKFINQWMEQQHPQIPIFLMGHSLGSFLVRRYIQKYAESLSGVILSGTAASPGVAGKIGKLIAKWEVRKRGAKSASPLLNRLSFGAFNRKVPNPKTAFDWLSRDELAVQEYIKDPLCGFICSASFFIDLFTGFELIHDDQLMQNIPKQIPMFIFSGEEDPVGWHGKGVRKVVQQYKDHGLTNIQSILYPNSRHEMLHELNKEEVYESVYQWVEETLKPS